MTATVNSASVIDLRAYVDPSVVPTLVLVDLQKDYIAAPRVLALPHAPQALANCRIALTHARTKGFPVAFVRWLGRSGLFNRATPFSGWIEGFEPTGADMVFERDRPSCYSSLSFGEVMSDSGSSFVLAGFAGESACLATAIDAFHRGHRITYLDDASASHTLDEIAAPGVHPHDSSDSCPHPARPAATKTLPLPIANPVNGILLEPHATQASRKPSGRAVRRPRKGP